jgi:hypothetical protein
VALAAIAIISLSVSPASAAVVASDHHSYAKHPDSYYHTESDKSPVPAKKVESYKPAAAQVERECPPKHRSSPPPPVRTPPVKTPPATPTLPHSAEGGGNAIGSGHTVPTVPTVTSRSRPAHIVTKPVKATPTPVAIAATAAVAVAPAETAVTPSLITAPAPESLALGDSPSTPTVSATSSAAAAATSSAPSTTAAAASRTINLASDSPSTLGLSDNLMLAALVAVFALAVIALVTAGGRRSGWRQH